MKQFITILALFVVLTLVFSGLTGCKGTQETAGNNAAGTAPNSNTTTTTTVGDPAKASVYPQLVSSIADAKIELADGTSTTVTERKGKIILLNLWGIWCGPCRAEMPALTQMQAKYGDQGFEVIGLNIGGQDGGQESLEAIKKFGTDMNLNYTLGRIDHATTQQIYLLTRNQVVPQSLLITRDGHLRGAFVGGGSSITASIQDTLQKALAE